MTNLVPASDLTRIRALVERVGEIEVVDTATNLAASAALRDIKTMREQIEKRVTDLRRPHMKAADAISQEAKPYLEELRDGEQHLRGVVTSYMVEQARMVREEEEAREATLERAIVDGDTEEIEAALTALTTPAERDWRPAGVSLQARWKAEVTDMHALVSWCALHPDRLVYLLVNERALLMTVREVGVEHGIPGVRAWQEQAVAAAGRN